MKNIILDHQKKYRNTLLNEIMPYWFRYAMDQSGAINNCLNEDGTLQSKDRYIWSQGRALWTFSALYNRIEKKEEYLKAANGLFEYLKHNGRDDLGKWNYLLDESNAVLEKDISIYVDGFVMCGMTEYYLATGNEEAKKIALEIFENTYERLQNPGSYRIAPYEIPSGMKTHGIYMIFSFFYYNLGKAVKSERICDVGYSMAMEILEKFYVREKGLVLEFVKEDGSFSDTPQGRTCVPGHVIEGMWFLITIFEDRKESQHIRLCCDLIKKHIEAGWDREKGGIILGFDIEGREPCYWKKHLYKPWWVQVEAMVATMYGYKHTQDPWFLKTHARISEYAYSHYPNGYGEWYNWLDNDGNYTPDSAALPVKDPFHLPRGLIYLTTLEMF